MADGRDILREWQDAMQSIAGAAAKGATGRSELPKALLTPMQRQLDLLQEVVQRERNLQAEVFGHLIDPIDAVFDLLEESGTTLRRQAEALEAAGRALEESAALMKSQAELFERTIGTLRQPAEFARAASGAKPRKRRDHRKSTR